MVIKRTNNIFDIKKKGNRVEEEKLDTDSYRALKNSKDLEELYKKGTFSNVGINTRFAQLIKRELDGRRDLPSYKSISEQLNLFDNSNVLNILEDLEITMLEAFNDELIETRVPFLNNLKFEFLKQDETRTIDDNITDTKLFKANRVSGVIEIDKATFSAFTNNEVIKSFVLSYSEKAVSEAIFTEIIKQITAKTAVNNYDTGDTAKAFNLADINTVESTLNSLGHCSKKYVVSNNDSQKLKQTDSGFNAPLLQRGYLNDLQCYSHKSVTDGSLIVADWSNVYVLLHYLNILVDEFTLDTKGKVLIRYNAYLDLDFDSNSVAIAKNFTA